MQHALRSSVTALQRQRREVQSPSRSLQKDDLGKGVLTEMSASYTLMLLTQEEWGTGMWRESTAKLPCCYTTPEVTYLSPRDHQSSVSSTINPVLQLLGPCKFLSRVRQITEAQWRWKFIEQYSSAEVWNYSTKMTFPLWPPALHSLHFDCTAAGTNKFIDIWKTYTMTTRSRVVAFFFCYYL